MQHAVYKYLESKPDLNGISKFYQQKRDLFLSAIKASGVKSLNCSGTYFCLLDYSGISQMNDVDFAKKLTIDFGIASIPISVFYQDQTDNKVLRFCFAKKDETLLHAAEKLCKI